MINPSLFIGKTIKSIEAHMVNVIVFHFTDDTKVEIEVEREKSGLYGLRSNICGEESKSSIYLGDEEER